MRTSLSATLLALASALAGDLPAPSGAAPARAIMLVANADATSKTFEVVADESAKPVAWRVDFKGMKQDHLAEGRQIRGHLR